MDKEKLLNQVNTDIIFFFLSVIQSMIAFYLITEKKKSILNIDGITNNSANKIYKFNRNLNFVISLYFFINAYQSYKEAKTEEDKKQSELLLVATFFILIGSALYLPLGNSNLIIEN